MKKSVGMLIGLLLLSAVMSYFPVRVKAAALTLTIISPHPEGIRVEFERAFGEYWANKTGNYVDIDWRALGGTSDIITYVDTAFAANNETTCNIDIWWGGGVDPFIAEKAKGHLVPYQVNSTILGLIPNNISGVPMYDTANYTWYGTALSGFGIVYNKVVLQAQGLPVPTTWKDLTNPKLKGWVVSANPTHSGSTHMAYEIMMQGYGWVEGWKVTTMLGANVKTWPTSSSAVPTSVGTGDVAYGLAIDYYAWSEIATRGADKIGYVMPEGLTVINPDSIAILKGAPNLDLAKAFVDFTLSKTGQKLLMLPKGASGGPRDYVLGRMSVLPSLYSELGNLSVVPVNPFLVKSQLNYNTTLGSLRYTLLNDMIGAMIIDQQADLAAVWSEATSINKTLTDAGVASAKIGDAFNKMSESPVTEATALSLSANWSNATLRNQMITQWHTFAVTKYKNASDLAKLAATDMLAYFQGVLNGLNTEKTNNLYMGLAGGVVVGLVVGVVIASFMGRRKEIGALKT